MKRLVALSLVSLVLGSVCMVARSHKATVSPIAKIEHTIAPVRNDVGGKASFTPVNTEDRERVFETLSKATPGAELKQWRERQAQELARYDQMATLYDKAEKVVRARVLSTQDPLNDLKLQRMNSALRQKLDQLLRQNKRLNQVTAEFNARLLSAINKPTHPIEN